MDKDRGWIRRKVVRERLSDGCRGTHAPSIFILAYPWRFPLCHAGYLTAVFGQLVGPSGVVLGVEKMEPLAQRSINSMQVSLPSWPVACLSTASMVPVGTLQYARSASWMESGLRW